jgi:exosortase/archaeosortase
MFSHSSTFKYLVFSLVTLKLYISFLVVSNYIDRFIYFLNLSVFLYYTYCMQS